MIKLSIIIPYYETYKFTLQLLKELRIQKTDEVEVILVDDGCNETRFDEFTEFTIIHNEHVGASAAWNIGIRQATGKYIGFIDSDDMIMMNYIETLIDAIDHNPQADEITFAWFNFHKNKLMCNPTARAIWKGIYKREIVPFFDETYVHGTDIPFRKKLNATPHTVMNLNFPLYIYRSRRVGSISWQTRAGKLKNPWEVGKDG